MTDLEYRPLILHVSHGSARGDVSLGGASELSLHTSMDALADGLRRMFRTDATPDDLFGELLAKLADLEHVAALHADPVQRFRAMLCEEIARREEMERQVASRTRERDEARTDCETLRKALSNSSDRLLDAMTDIGRLSKQILTPTQGAQP